MATYNYDYNGKTYVIELSLGKTIIKLGMNAETGLNEQLRFTRFFSDDEQKLMIISFNREFVSSTGVVVSSTPVAPLRVSNEPARTDYLHESDGTVTAMEVPAKDAFDDWDEKLGLPVLRKLFANALLGAIGVEAYFDEEEIV